MDTFYFHSPPPTPLFLKSHSRTGAQSNRLYRLCPLSQGCTLIWDVFIVSSSFFRGICQKIETGLKPHPSKCKGLQRRGQPTVYSALIVGAVLSRPMLTWCARTPKDLTCVRTIRSGTIPLLSQLLDPFRACSPALDQSATASTAASLGNVDRCSSHTLSLPRPPLSPLTSAPGLPPRGPSPSQPSLPLLPLFSASRCHGRSFLSGQQKSLFSSLLSTVMTKLPNHLLRLSSSLPRLQNPMQLQSPHK